MSQNTIKLEEFGLLMLMGIAGSGKTHVAQQHFGPTEVLSSKAMATLVGSDDPQAADVQEVLAFVLEKRLQNRLFTVVDARNLDAQARKSCRILAKKYHARLTALVLDLPPAVCAKRLQEQGTAVLASELALESQTLQQSCKHLKEEGFRHIVRLQSQEEIDQLRFSRVPMRSNLLEEQGPFDIIGDVHGCASELQLLLKALGYEVTPGTQPDLHYHIRHPEGRRIVFVGDLVDRGPDSPEVLKLAMSIVRSGQGFCVPGNHDHKLARHLKGNPVKLTHGLDLTVEQLSHESEEFRNEVGDFIRGLSPHIRLDGGRLLVAHAGLRAEMHGRDSGAITSFCLYGETTGETDEFGLPVRLNWAADYTGDTTIVFGHTPIPEVDRLNNTINIDTGCVFGGKLTALRWPEDSLVQIQAEREYAPPTRPLDMNLRRVEGTARSERLNADLLLTRGLSITRSRYNISWLEPHAYAAMSYLGQASVDPRWLIYLPAAFSPVAAHQSGNFLEHPQQAFDYYRKRGSSFLYLREMQHAHRASVVICKDAASATRHFGVEGGRTAVLLGRDGLPLLQDEGLEKRLLGTLAHALRREGVWEELGADWLCLDCEVTPLAAYARDFVEDYLVRPSRAALASQRHLLEHLEAAGLSQGREHAEVQLRLNLAERALNRASGLLAQQEDAVRLVPVTVVASSAESYLKRPRRWHLETIDRWAAAMPEVMTRAAWCEIDLDDVRSEQAAHSWWLELEPRLLAGAMAMPQDILHEFNDALVAPEMTIRSREGLRMVYGYDYSLPDKLELLRNRSLKDKRARAIREFALANEALQLFLEKRPLSETFVPMFAFVAVQAKPLDPRL